MLVPVKTEYLFDREVELVLTALTPGNRLVMRTALHTGLRIGDVLRLRTEQLQPHFWVTERKTGKRRQIGLPEPLLGDLKKAAGKVWVFEGRIPGKPRTRQAVWKDVKRAAKAFRLPVNVGPHSARKIYAAQLMERYGDIDRVRRALNHNSETVTLIYAMAEHRRTAKDKRRAKKGRRPS